MWATNPHLVPCKPGVEWEGEGGWLLGRADFGCSKLSLHREVKGMEALRHQHKALKTSRVTIDGEPVALGPTLTRRLCLQQELCP